MPVDYRIDRDRRLVISTGDGIVTLAEVKSHRQRLLSDPDFDRTFNQLIDLRGMTKMMVPAGEGLALASRSVFAETSRRALVVDRTSVWRTMVFLLVTVLSVHAESKVFHDVESAIRWLGVEIPPGE